MITPRRVGRLMASLGLIAALTLSAGAAAAAPSQHTSIHQVHVAADFATDDVVISLMFIVSDVGSGSGVEVWTPPETFYNHQPATFVAGDAALQLAADDSTLSGSVNIHLGETGELVGQLIVDVTLEPAGDAESFESKQGGNTKVRTSETIQPMAATGMLSFPAGIGSFELADAYSVSATVSDRDEFSNAPSSTVMADNFIDLLVGWEVDGITVMVIGSADKAFSYVDVAVILPDGTVLNGGQDDATFGRRSIEADVVLARPDGHGLAPTGGTLRVQADVTAGERTSYVVEDGDAVTRVTIQQLIADGTVEVSLDDGTFLSLDFADAAGSFADASQRFIDGGKQG